MPKGKTVVLGLITTKEPQLESEDELLRRIEQASKYVPTENLALSTQSTASAASGNLLSGRHAPQARAGRQAGGAGLA